MASRSKKSSAWRLPQWSRPLEEGVKFARKTIRCTGGVTREDVEREARIVTWLRGNDRHPNLVLILGNGWLKGAFNTYFIDMELCKITLHEYIRYLHDATPSRNHPVISPTADWAVIPRGQSAEARVMNTWTIGRHIASGLEFMHRHKYVHRDLKPRNGTSPNNCNAHNSSLFFSKLSMEADGLRNHFGSNIKTSSGH